MDKLGRYHSTKMFEVSMSNGAKECHMPHWEHRNVFAYFPPKNYDLDLSDHDKTSHKLMLKYSSKGLACTLQKYQGHKRQENTGKLPDWRCLLNYYYYY